MDPAPTIESTSATESAFSRAFDLPELLRIITSHLQWKDITRLMQTCRKFNEQCSPWFYRHINLSIRYGRGKNILESTSAALALARNVRSIRQLSSELPEMALLYQCLLSFYELYSLSTASVHLERPAWLPSIDRRVCQFIPIPPMTHLTSLTVKSSSPKLRRSVSFDLPSSKDHHVILAQICWIIMQASNLYSLTLECQLEDPQDIRLLSTTLSKLRLLKSFDLSAHSRLKEPFRWGSELFFSCSPLLENLKLDLKCNLRNTSNDNDKKPPRHNLPELPHRQEPLAYLTKLSVWDKGASESEEQLTRVLQHCPNLQELNIANAHGSIKPETIAKFVGEHCPQIRKLKSAITTHNANTLLPFSIMSSLPEQQIQEFECMDYDIWLDEKLVKNAIVRHSKSLTTLVLSGRRNMESKAVGLILTECGTLETFTLVYLHERMVEGDVVSINLEDAAANPWVCTRLKQLELTVACQEVPVDDGVEPYYFRDGPVVLSGLEQENFAQFEALYRNLGSLVELEILDIRIHWCDMDGQILSDSLYASNTFPGFLSLGDAKTGRPGYLNCLSGLKKLRKLLGSVSATTEEATETMGWDEVKWMSTHWPLLEIGEFFVQFEIPRAAFKWLKNTSSKHLILNLPYSIF
ncbi:hypothetical protein BGZ96_003154 [Linnemannia gamsii]|uniref:F-box domain-containing protein n=1 Tax=Linnemannia gamsii TaxID=64522 RepID=A0ABQ7K781_9FUNG|nr:hypothetical protein BGZ96_003154 [Linnemannia gamsii]